MRALVRVRSTASTRSADCDGASGQQAGQDQGGEDEDAR